VDSGVQRFHSSIEALRCSSILRYILDRQAGISQSFGSTSCAEQFNTLARKERGKVDNTRLVGNTDKGASDLDQIRRRTCVDEIESLV
jgi:hypothetical protein